MGTVTDLDIFLFTNYLSFFVIFIMFIKSETSDDGQSPKSK